MNSNSKRISIARAIMYKELAKRQEARVIECKRRGLWTLWQHQTQYKTLWHFLRASDDRLIALCTECADDLLDRASECMNETIRFEQCFTKNPCRENKENAVRYLNSYIVDMRNYNAIIRIRNKLEEAIHNETQN